MLRIVEAKKEDRDIMMNLLEKYLYEFSQWEKTDVNENGLSWDNRHEVELSIKKIDKVLDELEIQNNAAKTNPPYITD